jgi:hypothetical protein
MGFSNTWQVASFDTRAARDAWIAECPDRPDIVPITRTEAMRMVGKLQRMHYWSGGHLAHVHYLTADNVNFRRAY